MAQHFPPGSPYGPPYQPSAYYPAYQQYPNQSPASSSPFVPQVLRPPGNYQQPPNLSNLSRFEANSQAQNQSPAQSYTYGAGPYAPEMYKQFNNLNIPPLPLPNYHPVPFPNMAYPHYNQNFQPATPTPLSQQAATPVVIGNADAYDPRFPTQPLHQGRSGPPFPTPHDVHSETQGKDEGSASSRTISQEEQTHEVSDQSVNKTYPSNFDGSVYPTQPQPQPQDRSLEYSQPGEQQHQAPVGLLSASHGIPVQHPVASGSPVPPHGKPSSDGQPSVLEPALALKRHENKPLAELRELAKGALLSLIPHSINFLDLVKEGIEIEVLRQLYDDLGLKVEQQETSPSAAVSVTAAQTQVNEIQALSKEQEHLEVAELIVPASAPVIAKPVPAASLSLERKDRIAQLLAAKTGRPSPVRTFSGSAPSAEANDGQLGDVRPAPQSTSDHMDDPTAEVDTESKGAGVMQAEALKEKMERLRSENILQAQNNRNAAPTAASLTAASTAASAAAELLQISTQLPALEASLASIPGLFMTSADPMQRQNPSVTTLEHGGVSDTHRTSRKRSYEPEPLQNDPGPNMKRRNTDTTSDVMVIDDPEDQVDASEGEIADIDDNLSPSKNHEQLPVTASEIALPNGLPALTPTIGSTVATRNAPIPEASSMPVANQAKARLTSAQIAEKAEMLKAKFLKQRAERQKAPQDGLPDLDAEVQKTVSRLIQQQAQLSQIRLAVARQVNELQEARTQEKALLEDITQLEKQLKEGVAGQKEYTDELRKLSNEQKVPEPAAIPTPPTKTPELVQKPAQVDYSAIDEAQQQVETGQKPAPDAPTDTEDVGVSIGPQGIGLEIQPVSVAPEDTVAEQADIDTDSPMLDDDIEYDPAAAEAIQDTVVADDANVGYVPAYDNDTSAFPDDELVGDKDEFENEVGYYSDGSASMSDSGPESGEEEEEEEEEEEGEEEEGEEEEGEYEPDGVDPSHPMEIEGSEEGEYDPEAIVVEETLPTTSQPVLVAESLHQPERMADPKRLPTPTFQTSPEMMNSPTTDTVEVAPTGIADDGYDPRDPLIEDKSAEQAVQSLIQVDDTPPISLEADAMVEVEPRTNTATVATSEVSRPVSQQPLTSSGPSNGAPHAYAPYQSPLSSFQSFRYNENFNKSTVKDGYRSLTYSNNIDPRVPLCQTELGGGVCGDPQCEDQHFRHLGLSDDKILVSLSTAHDIEKPLRDEYLLSLKKVIARLRTQGVKEFEDVANALSEHRRDFFKKLADGGQVS